MASALATASRLKPPIRLAQAVSEFEADLTMEQKLRFNSYKTQVQKSPPEIHDVMRLTAEIDQKVSPKVGRGRCYGPRFTNFLQTVQQFVGLGDIIVGGSQNLVACGVWSLVRLSLLSMVNSASYLEKVSRLLMIVGRSAPRYQSMAELYPRSKELQSNLCEYFIVVVRLCHQVLKFTQKSAVMQFTSTLNSSSLDSYQPELEIWATAIKEEVNILMAKRCEDEANNNSKFRDWSLRSRNLESHQRQLAANRRVLDMCSRYDYQVKWKQTRRIGNATVFQSDPKYQNWKTCSHSSTLMYTGRLGSGKSVLMANIVDDLNLNVQENSTVAYFFCRHDEEQSLKTKTVIGSMARQILLNVKFSTVNLKAFDENDLKDLDRILELLKIALPPNHRVIFVLDGLDECDFSEAKELIRYIRKMQESFTLLLCVSLRLEPNKLQRYPPEQFAQCTATSIPVENPDIDIFIERELENRIQTKQLMIGNPLLILEIRDTLMAGSQGMFLWVALQIEILCAMKTDESIRQALTNLPKDLSDTFTRILQKDYPKTKPDQKTILEVIAVAQRPLNTEELREVLSVTPGDIKWDPGNLLNDVNSVLACCGGLVAVDEEESTVQLIHHSVKQFLIEEYCDLNGAEFHISNANLNMARLILTYLSYDHFGRQLSTSVVPRMNVSSTPYNIVSSTIDSHNSIQEVALKLLRIKTREDRDIGKTIQAMVMQHHKSNDSASHFLGYASLYWIHHLCATSATEISELSMLDRILDRHTVSIDDAVPYSRTFSDYLDSEIEPRPRNKHPPITRRKGRGYLTSRNNLGGALLFWACNRRDSSLLRRLVLIDHVDLRQYNEQMQTPLSCAVLHGNRDAVQVLLSTRRAIPDSGNSPLLQAAKNRQADIIMILGHYEGVPINSRDDLGRTALSYAAQVGSPECVRELLKLGAYPTLADDMGRTPLTYAAMSCSANTVQQLCDWYSDKHGDFPDTKDIKGRTALSYAAGYGTSAIVRIFLRNERMDPDSRDTKNRSPLSYAAQYGTQDIVDALLADFRVDADSRCVDGLSPLSWAIERKPHRGTKEEDTQLSIVRAFLRTFLRTGRVTNSRDFLGQTVLTKAVIHQCYSIVAILLDHGCAVHIKDNSGLTPLDYARDSGNKEIVHLLRAHTSDN